VIGVVYLKVITLNQRGIKMINKKEEWKDSEELLKKAIADIPSSALFGKQGIKWCKCSATELRYILFFDHTWEEHCPKCGITTDNKSYENRR